MLRVTRRCQAAGGNQQIQENDGLVGGRASLKAVLEKVRFQYLMGAYNSEELFCVAPHPLQANWLGIFDEVMNTAQDAQYVFLHLCLNPRAHSLNNADSQLSDTYGAEASKILRLKGQNKHNPKWPQSK